VKGKNKRKGGKRKKKEGKKKEKKRKKKREGDWFTGVEERGY